MNVFFLRSFGLQVGKTRFFVFSQYYRAFKKSRFEVQKYVLPKRPQRNTKPKKPRKDKEEQAKEDINENTEEVEEVVEEKEIDEAEILG